LSAAENRFDLVLIGERAANTNVSENHFFHAFDVPFVQQTVPSTEQLSP
jgi:hypothetical protein